MLKASKNMSDIANYGQNPWLNGAARDTNRSANRYKLTITDADLGEGFHFFRQKSRNSLLLICRGGQAQIHIEGWANPCLVQPGHAVYVTQGKQIRYESYENSRFQHYGVEWNDQAFAPQISIRHEGSLRADTDTFAFAYQGLCREIAADNDDEVLAAWLTVVHQFCVRTISGNQSYTPLSKLRLVLNQQLSNTWTLSDMADVLNISETSLRRLCQSEVGEAPKQMLFRMRMERAAELLLSTSASMTDIAQQVGYESAFSFSKAFRRHFDKSPSQHRKSGR